jgi:hypothetical protein
MLGMMDGFAYGRNGKKIIESDIQISSLFSSKSVS